MYVIFYILNNVVHIGMVTLEVIHHLSLIAVELSAIQEIADSVLLDDIHDISFFEVAFMHLIVGFLPDTPFLCTFSFFATTGAQKDKAHILVWEEIVMVANSVFHSL
jgi:hypothetical protein